MDFEGHPAATHLAVVSHQNLNKLHVVFGFVILQEAKNHCDKAVPSCFLHSSEVLGELLALHDLYLWTDEDTSICFYHRQLREEILEILESCIFLI